MINSWRCCNLAVSSISLDDMPGPGLSSPVSVLHNSPFYSPVRERDSPSQAATSTFSTFQPQLRTSPEGSSCGDTDLEQPPRGQLPPEFSSTIGRATTRLGSHWSRGSASNLMP